MVAIPSTVTTLPSTGTGSTSSSAAAKSVVDYNSFLTLLVAQMKNQDPTSPTDSTAYMSQLAAFSQVGQSVETNTKLTDMLSRMSVSQAEGLIGREIRTADGSVSGTVRSVSIVSNGATALLDNGKSIAIAPGIVIG
jgi:flagellar basal-body rod modification protein FlgD